jgi:hypothetical protein
MNLRKSLAWYRSIGKESGQVAEVMLPRSSAELKPRDEAIFLLHCAAEVEHSLLVQYLYAGYSLRSESDEEYQQEALDRWRVTLFEIARQEMGHLATVQNLLLAIGGPLNFQREDFPFRSGFYPFHFRLERLTRDSVGKYLVAEMPDFSTLPVDKRRVMRHAIRRATEANARTQISRVGALYLQISKLIERLVDGDFRFDTFDHYQARATDFGFVDPGLNRSVITEPFISRVESRTSALRAISLVAEQGEGTNADISGSHFDHFFQIFTDAVFPETNPLYGAPSWIATHAVPNEPQIGSKWTVNKITNSLGKRLAQLGNVRYRNALLLLELYFRLDAKDPKFDRKLVANWIKEEMKPVLSSLGSMLPLLSRQAPKIFLCGEEAMCGLPFHLPYTLSYSYAVRDHWRAAKILIKQSTDLAGVIHGHPSADEGIKRMVQGIKTVDHNRADTIDRMSA